MYYIWQHCFKRYSKLALLTYTRVVPFQDFPPKEVELDADHNS